MEKKFNTEYALNFYGGKKMGLIPIIIFILTSASLTTFFKVYSMKGLVLASLMGLFIDFFFCKSKPQYWKVVIEGLAKFANAKLIFILLLVGIFTKVLIVGGIGNGFIWLSMHLNITGSAFVVATFLATTIVSMGLGAPLPTVLAFVPLFCPPGVMLGAKMTAIIGAILSGVFFGDAMSPSSQIINTTLDTQHDAQTQQPADIQIVMRERTPYLIGIALISVIFFYLFGASGANTNTQQLALIAQNADGKGLVMLIPIIVLLIISFIKKNLFLGLSYAIVIGLILGIIMGNFQFQDVIKINHQHEILGILIAGAYSMTDIIISSILLYGMIAIAIQSGSINQLCQWILSKKAIQSQKGAQLVILLSVGLINVLLSGRILAPILLFGNVADRIGQSAKLSPNKRAYLLTGSVTTITAINPINSAFIMGSISLANQIRIPGFKAEILNPFQIFSATYYCFLLTIVCFFWAFKTDSNEK